MTHAWGSFRHLYWGGDGARFGRQPSAPNWGRFGVPRIQRIPKPDEWVNSPTLAGSMTRMAVLYVWHEFACTISSLADKTRGFG